MTNKIGLLGKSFSDIFSDLKSGRGIFTSLFADVVSNDEIIRVTDYINAVQNGLMSQEAAWDTYMKSAGSAAQGWARDVSAGRKSIDDLSTATLTARSAFQSLGKVALNVGVSILNAGLSFAVFYGVSKIFEAISDAIVTTEEAAQNMTDAFAEYDDAKQKVVDIDTELESIQTRMNELSAKKGLTFVEQGELDNLKEVTRQLEIQKQLAEWEEKRAAEKAAAAAETKWNKTNRKDERYAAELVDEYYRSMSGEYSRYLDFDGGQNINALFAAYRGFTEERDRYAEIIQEFVDKPYEELDAEQQWAIDYYNNTLVALDAVEGALQDYAVTYGEYYDAFMDLPVESLDSDQKAILQIVEQTTDIIKKTLDPAGWKQDKLDQIFDDEALAKQRQELVKLAAANKGVGLSIEDIDTTKYSGLIEALDNKDFSLQDLVDYINSQAEIIDINSATDLIKEEVGKQITTTAAQSAELEVDIEPKLTLEEFNSWYDNLPDDHKTIVFDWVINGDMDISRLTIDDLQEKINTFLKDRDKTLSFAELMVGSDGEESEYVKQINDYIKQWQYLQDILKKVQDGKLDPNEQIELFAKYPDIAAAGVENLADAIQAELNKISGGAVNNEIGETLGLKRIADDMWASIDQSDPKSVQAYKNFWIIVADAVSTAENATPIFETFEDALNGVSNAAGLYKTIQQEISSGEGLSLDTVLSGKNLLGDAFDQVFTITNGQFKVVDNWADNLRSYVVDAASQITELPDGITQQDFSDAMGAAFDSMKAEIEGAITPAEQFSNALSQISTLSQYMSDIGSGDFAFVDALKSASDIIANLPADQKLGFKDLFTIGEDNKVTYNNGFYDTLIDSYINSLMSSGKELGIINEENEEAVKTAIKNDIERTKNLNAQSDAFDQLSDSASLYHKMQEEMAEDGSISYDTLMSAWKTFGSDMWNYLEIDNGKILAKNLENIKTSAEGLLPEGVTIENWAEIVTAAFADANKEVKSFDDYISEISSGSSLLSAIQEDLEQSGKLSVGTIQDIFSAFGKDAVSYLTLDENNNLVADTEKIRKYYSDLVDTAYTEMEVDANDSKYQQIKQALIDSLTITPEDLPVENLEKGIDKIQNVADLYKSVQQDLESGEGISLETITSGMSLLGEDFWTVFGFENGQLKLKQDLAELKSTLITGLYELLPEEEKNKISQDQFDQMLGGWFDGIIEGAEESQTALEKLQDAFGKMTSISDFMSEMGSGELGFIEQLEAGINLLDDLPEGTKLNDIFSFDSGNLATNTAFINKQTNEYIKTIVDAMGLEGLEAKQMEATLRGRAAQTRQMERYSNVMDKTSNASSILTKAQEEMNESGKNSVDTFSELMDLFGTEAFTMATIGADGIVINQQAVKDKMMSEIDKVFGDNALGQQLKDQLEVEIETASFDDALDNYVSKTNTLKDALDTLKTEELSEADYFELIREFPELAAYTDDLATGIKSLLGDSVKDIGDVFDEQISQATIDGNVDRVLQLQALKQAALDLAKVEEIEIVVDIEAETEGFEKLQTAINESASATGMSAESVEALRRRYAGLMGELDDDVELFQRTANGITLNTKAVSQLEKAYQRQNIDKVDRELGNLTKQYDDLESAIASTSDTAQRDSLVSQKDDIAKRIQELAELRSQYAGLTSSFNAWQSAQSSANERDSYESVGAGYEEMKQLFESGWYGDDSLNAYLDLMFGSDRQKDMQSMIAQMEKLGEINERYWTKDDDGKSTTDGLFNFLDDIEKNEATQGIIKKTLDKAGEEVYSFDFSAENINRISEAFGMSAEMVGMFASALSDAGGNVVFFDEYTDKLVGVEKASKSTQNAIKDMAEKSGKSIEGMPEYNIENLTSVEEIQEQVEAWENYKKSVEGNDELVAAVNAEQERLGRKSIDLQIQAKLDSGKTIEELAGLSTNEEIAVEFGLDMNADNWEEQAEKIKQQISSFNVELPMTVKLDEAQFQELSNDDLEGEVAYTANFDAISGTTPPPLDGVINYEAKFGEISAPTIYGKVVYRSTVMPKADGTAHVSGTAFARGSWGIKDSGTALGGELGTETIVRDGQYFTIGEHGAEFFKYQKGDIIFNHKQTEELFKYGRVTSSGGRGRAYADGSEYQSHGDGLYRRPVKKPKKNKGGKGETSNGNNDNNSSEFEEVFDWIEIAIDRIERAIDSLNTKASSVFKSWADRSKSLRDQMSLIREEIELQQDAYDRYIEEANSVGLDEEYAQLVRDGAIDIETIKDEELAKKIKEYQEWYEKAIDCRDAVDDLEESLAECYQTAFDNVVAKYDGMLSVIEHEKSMLDEYINQSEAMGHLASKEYYNAMIQQEQENIDNLRNKKSELEAAMQDAVNSGAIVEGSEAWYEMLAEINDVSLSIEEANTRMIEYNNTMREIDWERFDLLQEKISNVAKESDFLIDLLDNSDLFDDRGQLSEEGLAVAGLHGMNYDLYMDQADKYAEEIKRIDEQLANNPYDQALINRKQELIELQQESITSAENEKQAIRDMVEEGINLELDALQELIDSYTEALDSQKDLYDYQKKIKEETKEIADLEKQMAAYQGDTSEESKKRIQEIKASLEEARENLEETEYDQYIEDQKELLDKMYEEYEEILNKRLDDIDALMEDMINSINSGSDTINTTIETTAGRVGYDVGEAIKTAWRTSDGENAIVMYDSDVADSISTSGARISNVLEQIKQTVVDMANASDSHASNRTNGYASGVYKIKKNELAWTQEGRNLEAIIRPSDGAILTPLKQGDSVLNSNATANMFDFANNPAEFIREHMKNNIAVAGVATHDAGGNTYDNEFNIQIALPNVANYEQFKKAMQNDKGFEQMIRAMTVDRMFGGSSLKKYRY